MSVGILKNHQLYQSFFSKNILKGNFLVLVNIFIGVAFLVFLIAHVLLVNNEIKVMKNYTDEILVRANQAASQIKTVLVLTNLEGNVPCSERSLKSLREVLSHNYLIEDAGIFDGYQVICTAKIGVLDRPRILNYKEFIMSALDRVSLLRPTKDLFFPGEKRSLFKFNNAFITLVPNLYIGIEFPDKHTGAILISPASDRIFRTFNGIDKDKIEMAKENVGSVSQFLPFSNRFASVEKCSGYFDFCVRALDYRLGIYDVSNKIIILLLSLSLLLSYSIMISFYYFKNVKGTMKYRLIHAIKKNKIFPLYQPKINLKSGKIVGVEALARWQDDKLGFVPPDVFIALAEENQLINKVTMNLTKIILQESKSLLLEHEDFTVSINLSVQDMVNSEYFAFLEAEVRRHGIARRQIILEITERSATESEDLSSSAHNYFQKGYQISLDDFGTGFCNLAWLSKLESNEIKIDRMFTHSISTNSVGLITLNGICRMLENFHMKTVFEGIETEEELAYILEKSPDAIGQGWLFAKAMPMAEVQRLMSSKQE